ncbi:hypothetical protein HYALB_00002649 [Hymenoscyphus albidus]|uniref:Uncharacterized protein n=1 Tax=Hymenoscyphus albidus TaxID=595503 RepID=A0A9N9QA95_9HELO|nr:hypothetical protein HYALB_00002649 [Hymenoscyphus albidus]
MNNMHHHLKHFAYFVSIVLNCRKQCADDESKTDTEMTWHKLRLELEMGAPDPLTPPCTKPALHADGTMPRLQSITSIVAYQDG